jgi:hypothetical protein
MEEPQNSPWYYRDSNRVYRYRPRTVTNIDEIFERLGVPIPDGTFSSIDALFDNDDDEDEDSDMEKI